MSSTDWSEEPKKEISVAEMDNALGLLRTLKEEYSTKKKESDEAYAKAKEQEATVIQMLKDCGKSKYVSDAGKAALVEELTVTTPKSPEEKRAFFNWLLEHQGQDVHDHYLSVNSRSLNTLFKNLNEEYAARGEVLEIDGLQPPSSFTKLQFRK